MAEALEYASTCTLPTTFIDLPLVAKREHNHDSTIYTFGLPEGKSLALPVCACVLLKAPGKGRGPNGKDDFDGSDAIRPYTPISDNSMLGQFELMVKRYDGGSVSVVSEWLYGLELGAKVGFKHTSFNIKAPYPFEGKKSITLLCARPPAVTRPLSFILYLGTLPWHTAMTLTRPVCAPVAQVRRDRARPHVPGVPRRPQT